MRKRAAPPTPAIPAAKATCFLLLHLLHFAGPALGSPLARLGFHARLVSTRETQTHSQTAPQLFTTFRKPGKDDVLATGTVVMVSWATGGSYGGTVVLELGAASEDAPLRSFVHTECRFLPFVSVSRVLELGRGLLHIWIRQKLTSFF
jgi:hypothetical protein